jgi:hypothetical protein
MVTVNHHKTFPILRKKAAVIPEAAILAMEIRVVVIHAVAIRAAVIRAAVIHVAAIRTAVRNAMRCALPPAIASVPPMTIMVSVTGRKRFVKRVVRRNAIEFQVLIRDSPGN